ncbi:MAG: Ig-like domain-containing protein [Bacteroidota bacterium]
MLSLLIMVSGISCDDAAAPDVPISLTITQPSDSQVVSGTVLRILTETSSQCGCNSHVEFFIDGVHVYSHYQPFYYYDWNITGLSGEHVIRARLVVTDDGEANDSVRVFIQ